MRIAGSGLTTPMVVFALAAVFVAGLAAFWKFGPADRTGASLVPALSPPPKLGSSSGIVVPLILASASMVTVSFNLLPISWGLALMAGALVYAVVGLYKGAGKRLTSRSPEPEPGGATNAGGAVVEGVKERRILSPTVHRLLLASVLALVYFRGSAGPLLHDWPFIRGVDQYNHAVMANEMLSDGRIFPYLIYPPGFHAMTASTSLLSGLEPLQIFSLLAPTILLLPALSLYALARRLWGADYGLVAAAFAGLLLGGPYQYFSDAMYPNMFTSQFLFILCIASLFELYARPSIRPAILFTLLGSSVFLYHQVGSLYLALLLVPVGAYFVYGFYKRERQRNAILLASLATMGFLSALYVWDTYNLSKLILGLLSGSENEAATGEAVSMAVGTQLPFSPIVLVSTVITEPVTWLGLLGVFLLAKAPAADTTGDDRRMYRFVRFAILAWVAVLAVGAANPLAGFPQRFARDLGLPLALLAALVFVSLLSSLVSSARSGDRTLRLAPALGIFLLVAAVEAQAAINLHQATGTQTPLTFTRGLTVTPEIAAAGEWLKNNNTGRGNIMVSPQGNQVPSRMMLAMSGYSAMQSYPEKSIVARRDLPPAGAEAMWDVLHVMEHPAGSQTRQLLEDYDVRYVVLFKYIPDRPIVPYWQDFLNHPDLYRVAFENEDVLIVEPRTTEKPP